MARGSKEAKEWRKARRDVAVVLIQARGPMLRRAIRSELNPPMNPALLERVLWSLVSDGLIQTAFDSDDRAIAAFYVPTFRRSEVVKALWPNATHPQEPEPSARQPGQ